MKSNFLFLAAAAMVFAGCANDEYPTDISGVTDTHGAIMFSPKKQQVTRGDYMDEAAAALLNNNFIVEGIKGDGTVANQVEVFDHYNVLYTANTANTTESNVKNWEYVGVGKHGLSAVSAQTVKYWDYSAKQYDFIAFSYGKTNYTKADLTEMKYANLGKAVDATGHDNAVYTVSGDANEIAKTYIADLVTLYNRDGVSEYKNAIVTPKFRSLSTKVRVAFYETVPGYSVTNLKFYDEAWDGSTVTSDAGADEVTLFSASPIFPTATTNGTMSIYYPTVGWDNSANGTPDADYNQAHIKFEAGTGDKALASTKTFGTLTNMAGPEGTEATGNIYLGRTSNNATYAGDVTATGHAYQIVLPLGSKDNIQLRVEYDLVPTDGATGTIHVRDARAVVPAAYADWQPNYAYTYIFKISNNTNGWTGVDGNGDVVEGLTPITFDAVVVETEEGVRETITTISTPSITTYQKGKVVTSYNEYEAGNIYSAVMNSDATPVTLTTTNCCYYEVTAGKELADEAIIQDMLNGTKHDTGITLASKGVTLLDAIPGTDTADGNAMTVEGKVAKLDVYAGRTYVFAYFEGGKTHAKVIRVK